MSAEIAPRQPFNATVIIWVIAAAILGFLAFLFLSTYAPEMRDGNDGSAHALSKSAIGYTGIVKLETELGNAPELATDDDALNTPDLLVLAPDINQDPDELAKLVAARDGIPTLIVLPKHMVMSDPLHPGWVYNLEDYPTNAIPKLLSKIAAVKITRLRTTASANFGSPTPTYIFTNAPDVQTIAGDGLTPTFTDDLHPNDLKSNHFIIARTGANVFILSDPDLLNNLGMADPVRAYAAVKLLQQMTPAQNPHIMFDLTLNGFKHGRGLLDLILRPPFLALTIALIVAALMALLNGLVRFGPAMAEARAIPHGKGALVANTADLLKLAKVEHQLGGRYASLIRDLAASQFGLPHSISADAATTRFDAMSREGPKFSDLAYMAEHANDRATVIDAAQKLDQWRRSK